MSLKSTARRIVAAAGQVPWISAIIRQESVRARLGKMRGAQVLYGNGWDRVHPFDRANGTDTSGFVSAEELPENEAARVHAVCYAGSQPSVLRQALAALPAVHSCTFLDLGCGKGRALLVASELPFRDILGVELSPPLAAIARHNADIVARRHPERTPVRVAVADASTFALPDGDLVIFLYHPFGAELVARVVASIEAALAAGRRSIYIVYYNPVAGHCFDASTRLDRRYARLLAYAPEERGFGPDELDALVIWQGGDAPAPDDAAPADARIVLIPGGVRVHLDPT